MLIVKHSFPGRKQSPGARQSTPSRRSFRFHGWADAAGRAGGRAARKSAFRQSGAFVLAAAPSRAGGGVRVFALACAVCSRLRRQVSLSRPSAPLHPLCLRSLVPEDGCFFHRPRVPRPSVSGPRRAGAQAPRPPRAGCGSGCSLVFIRLVYS